MWCPVCSRNNTKKVSVLDPAWQAGHERCSDCGYQAHWEDFFVSPQRQCRCGHEDPQHNGPCTGLQGPGIPCECRGFHEADPEYQGCILTYERLVWKLGKVEGFLAKRLGLDSTNARERLMDLDKMGDLQEDAVVSEWHADLACYLHWTKAGTL